MEKFYFEPLWSTPGMSTFYRYYNPRERTESAEIYCNLDPDKAFDDVHYLAEARFLINGKIWRLYVSPHEHVLQTLPCIYEVTYDGGSGIYQFGGCYARVVVLNRKFCAGQTVWRGGHGIKIPQILTVCEDTYDDVVSCAYNGEVANYDCAELYTDEASCAAACELQFGG